MTSVINCFSFTNHEKDFDSSSNFESIENNSTLSYPVSGNIIQKGMIVLMGEDRPCKITEITYCKTGKHGSRKIIFTGIDIFNERKYEKIMPISHTIQIPFIYREEYTLMGIFDVRYPFLMDKQGIIRQDIRLGESVKEEEILAKLAKYLDLNKDIKVSVIKCMNIEMVEEVRDAR